MAILILLICESIGLLSQLFLGKNQLNNDVRKENENSDCNTHIDPQEDNLDDFDETSTFKAFYKSFVDNLNITSEEELDVKSQERTSFVNNVLDGKILICRNLRSCLQSFRSLGIVGK